MSTIQNMLESLPSPVEVQRKFGKIYRNAFIQNANQAEQNVLYRI